MIKKAVLVLLSFTLAFGTLAYAENSGNNELPSINENRGEADRHAHENDTMQGEPPAERMQSENMQNDGMPTDERTQHSQFGEEREGQRDKPQNVPQNMQSENNSNAENSTSKNEEKNVPEQSENNFFSQNGPNNEAPPERNEWENRRSEPFGAPNDFNGSESTERTGFVGFVKTYQTPIASIVLLVAAYVFVLLYKRKRY